MLIKRNQKKEGICFAWTPKRTPQGYVWLEWVHFQYINTGLGDYIYARWIPEKRYNAGERRRFVTDGPETWEQEQVRLLASPPYRYETPPEPMKCRNLRSDGPTPCWYPSCTCMNVGGSTCGVIHPDQVDAENGR